MHPREFIQKWHAATLKERSGAHEHFIDLCHLLDERTPAEADPEGVWYCFERGARKTGGGDGWADVWKRRCFGWEYKGKRANLDDAFAQLQRYAIALENPPLPIAGGLGAPAAMHPVGAPAPNGIISDIDTVRVQTNFTNTVQQVHTIALDDLGDPAKRRLLKWAFSEPERLRPGTTREAITERAASEFAELARVSSSGEPWREEAGSPLHAPGHRGAHPPLRRVSHDRLRTFGPTAKKVRFQRTKVLANRGPVL